MHNSLTSFAWRNLWRNRRRTLITLASIVLGFFLAILMTAMQDRAWSETIDLAARLGGGHVSIQHPAHAESPTLRNHLGDVETLVAAALELPQVRGAVPRVAGQAMVSTAHESYGAGFIAFDPRRETAETLALLEATELPEEFVRGDNAVLLGARLAENLRAREGDRIVYTLTDTSGEIVSGLARLRGTVTTGVPSLDAAIFLLPLDALRRSLALEEDEATEVAVFVHDQRDSDRVSGELGGRLDEVAVLPWSEGRPELATFVAMKVGGALFMEALIALLVAAGIFNTLFVGVMERMREFGILRAIGWSSPRLFRLVMLESLILALIGLALGALVTIGPYLYLARHGIDMTAMLGEQGMEVAGVGMSPVLRVGIFPENAALIAVLAVAAVLASGVYPAWRASSVEPVEAIKLV